MAATKSDKINAFNTDGVGQDNGKLFGLPFNFDESEVVLLPVPWDVTTSYRDGTHKGPDAILQASSQLDLYDAVHPDGWQAGIYMMEVSKEWQQMNHNLRPKAKELIRLMEIGKTPDQDALLKRNLDQINNACSDLKRWVFEETSKLLDLGKITGVVGGEHSVPLGYLEALAQHHEAFGILQIDAHADLRIAFEGFTYSHASIMHNALKIPQVTTLVPVGLRDLSHGEVKTIQDQEGRIVPYYDHDLKEKLFTGASWEACCNSIITALPSKVYISFDIDGLEPTHCPNTGTPVPGGLSYDHAIYLLRKLVAAGKQIIGFDLCEVSPGRDEWDGNVGARVLYQLSLAALRSQQNA